MSKKRTCRICGKNLYKFYKFEEHIIEKHDLNFEEYCKKFNILLNKNEGKTNPFIKKNKNGFNHLTTKEKKQKFGSQKEKHPLWNKHHSKETIKKIKKSCSKSGKEFINSLTIDQRKEKFGLSGKLNPMYGKSAPIGSGRCKWYKYNGENLQGSYELRFAKWLDKNNIKWKKVHKSIKYNKFGVSQTYLPDFKVWFDKKPVYIETKGFFSEESQLKMKLVREQHKNKIFIIVNKELLKQYENSKV